MSKQYKVKIIEHHEHEIIVEADDNQEAGEIAERIWSEDENYNTDSSEYKGIDVQVEYIGLKKGE